LKGFVWGNLTLLVLFSVSLSYPSVRLEVAKSLDGISEFLYRSVDKEEFFLGNI